MPTWERSIHRRRPTSARQPRELYIELYTEGLKVEASPAVAPGVPVAALRGATHPAALVRAHSVAQDDGSGLAVRAFGPRVLMRPVHWGDLASPGRLRVG